MKYISHELRGTHEYLKKQLIFEIIKTLLLFAMALGIFFIGYFTLHTKKSLWSVIAVLAMLPACKSLVGVIMFARFKSLDSSEYNSFKSAAGNIPLIVENVITTSQQSYYIKAIACKDNTVVGYLDCKKSSDAKTVNEHLATVLKNGGHKNVTVKIFDKKDDFLKRVAQMNDNLSDGGTTNTEAIFTTIKAVSL